MLPKQNGIYNLTPYGMGAPITNQDYFGLGSNGSGPAPMNFADYSTNGLQNPMQGFQMPSFNMTGQGAQSSAGGIFGDGAGFLGSNIMTDDLKLGIGGIQTLGNLWGGMKSLGLAEKQFDFSKMMAEKNLNNQTQSYNTALTDRITSRAKAQGMSDQEAQAYLAKNSLPK